MVERRTREREKEEGALEHHSVMSSIRLVDFSSIGIESGAVPPDQVHQLDGRHVLFDSVADDLECCVCFSPITNPFFGETL